MRLGVFCVMRSAPPKIARSTTIRCATSSAADHSSRLGLLFQRSRGIASAARKNAACARPSFPYIASREGTPPCYQEPANVQSHSDSQAHPQPLPHGPTKFPRPKFLGRHQWISPRYVPRLAETSRVPHPRSMRLGSSFSFVLRPRSSWKQPRLERKNQSAAGCRVPHPFARLLQRDAGLDQTQLKTDPQFATLLRRVATKR